MRIWPFSLFGQCHLKQTNRYKCSHSSYAFVIGGLLVTIVYVHPCLSRCHWCATAPVKKQIHSFWSNKSDCTTKQPGRLFGWLANASHRIGFSLSLPLSYHTYSTTNYTWQQLLKWVEHPSKCNREQSRQMTPFTWCRNSSWRPHKQIHQVFKKSVDAIASDRDGCMERLALRLAQ